MTKNQIRGKPGQYFFQLFRKSPFKLFQHFLRQILISGTVVRHLITHSQNRIGQFLRFIIHRKKIHGGNIRKLILLCDPANHSLFFSQMLIGFKNLCQVNTGACTAGFLCNDTKYFHIPPYKKDCPIKGSLNGKSRDIWRRCVRIELT